MRNEAHGRSAQSGLGVLGSDFGLTGYVEDFVIAPGEKARFMASGPGLTADCTMRRLRHGDPHEDGPGVKYDMVDWDLPATVSVDPQPLDLGSYVEVPHSDSLNPKGSFLTCAWIQPTLPNSRWQAIISQGSPGDFSFGMYLAGENILVGAMSVDGRTPIWARSFNPVRFGAWQFVALYVDLADGRLRLSHQLGPASQMETWSYPGATKPAFASAGRVLIGALDTGTRVGGHFNGKISRPMIVSGRFEPERLRSLASGDSDPEDRLAVWDFSQGISGQRVVDVSGNANHGTTRNMPARGVTGPDWLGTPAKLYQDAPSEYDAVYFHDDDLDDAGWAACVEIVTPETALPGIYSLHLGSADDQLWLPFVVTSQLRVGDLALLLPTLSWQAYSSNRLPYSWTNDAHIDTALSIYTPHSDGSMNYYSSSRKPTRALDPTKRLEPWGHHGIIADLYIVDWLEHQEQEYSVFTDHDLAHRGMSLLESHRCWIIGSHPEYWTESMMRALNAYISSGGRVMHLGGNGLYWVTSIDPDRPWLMEVRKSGEGDYDNTFGLVAPDGEYQHSTTLQVGGPWTRRGFASNQIVGVEHAGNIFTDGSGERGYVRTAESRSPKYDWIFDGVQEDLIGAYGLNLGSAVGYETDAIRHQLTEGEDRTVTLLARSTHPDFDPPKWVAATPSADMCMVEAGGGGAVFTTGSVTWSGSLSHDDYSSDISAITLNVLRRFLDTPSDIPVIE
jgi:N,N-dimethylformamidase